VSNWISLKTGLEEKFGVTECWECARILGVQRGALPDGVLPDVELFDFQI
jgi:hypothetical protein